MPRVGWYGNRWLFTPTKVAQKRHLTSKITKCATTRILTYTMNEFVSPRVKFLPKAAPVDCALLLFTRARHFLFFLWRAGTRTGRGNAMLCERARLRVDEEITPVGKNPAINTKTINQIICASYCCVNK